MKMTTRIICLLILSLATTSIQAQYIKSYPRLLLPYEHGICRVRTIDTDGTRSHGSGVLLESPTTHTGKNYVLTAYHVVSDRNRRASKPIEVTWDGENFYDVKVAAARPGCDSALLEILSPLPENLPRVSIATEDVRLGETVYVYGFGDIVKNKLRCHGGPMLEYTMNKYDDRVWFDLIGHTRDGDSGGPALVIRDGKPYVVGNLWGCVWDGARRHYTVAACRLRVLWRLFGKEKAATYASAGRRMKVVRRDQPTGNF